MGVVHNSTSIVPTNQFAKMHFGIAVLHLLFSDKEDGTIDEEGYHGQSRQTS